MKGKLLPAAILLSCLILLAAAVGPAEATIAFRNASNAWAGPGTSLTINKPAGVVDNDVMLLVFYIENTTLVPSVAGTWTLLDNIANGTNYNTYVYYRRASAEPASYAITWDGTSRVVAAAIVAYSGVVTTGSPVDVYSKLTNAYSPSMTANGVTPTNTDDMLVFLGTHYTSTLTATPPTGMLERNDSNSVYAADQLLTTSAPTGDETATLSGDSISAGFLVALKAAQGVVTPNHLTTACTATSPYTTASIAPGANRLVLLWVNDRGTGTPTVSSVVGNGLNWVQVNTVTFGSNGRLTLYRAMGAAPTAGTVTISFSAAINRACWSIVEYDGVNTSGTDGSGAVVQSVTGTAASTSLTVTLAAFANANNVATGGFSTIINSTYTAGTGFGIYGSAVQATNLSIATEGLPTNDTTVDISVAASTTIAGIAVEVRKEVTCAAVSDASYVAANAQAGQAIVYWASTNPVVILEKSGSAITDVPTNGTTYSAGQTIGASTVKFAGSGTSYTRTGLANGTTYYYKAFANSGTCYAPGISVTARPAAGPDPAWSYMMANGSTMRGGIAGNGSVNTAGNFARIISLNTANGTQSWAPVATTGAVQGWLTWLTQSYPYRQPLTVTAGSAAVPSGYSVPVTLNHASLVSAGKSLASGNDVRVFYWNGTTWVQLDRVLDSGSAWNSATTKIWFKTQAAIAASGTDINYYLYYGNPNAANPPANKANVFLFADDFEGGTLSKWTILSGGWQVATDQKHGGTYSLKYPTESGTSDKWIFTNPALNEANVYLDTWWRFSVLDPANSRPDMAQLFRADGAGSNDYEANLESQSSTREGWDIAETIGGTWSALNTDTVSTAAANTWTRIGTAIYGTGMRVFKDGTQINPTSGSFNVGSQLASGTIGFHKWNMSSGAWWVDDVIVRRYVDPEPTAAPGTEQATTAGVVIGGDQSGRVYAVDATSGGLNWSVALTGADAVQAPVAAQLQQWSNAAFQAAYTDDVLFAATRNSSATTNKLFALKAMDGTVLWSSSGNPVFVQSKNFLATAGSATTVPVTFTSNVVAGNLIAVWVTWGSSTATLNSVTDSLGNTYTIVQTVTNTTNSQRSAMAYAKNIAGGANTVTATFSASIDYRGIIVHEISGADQTAPLDGNAGQWQTGPGLGTDAVSSGSFTTTKNGDYIFGASMNTGVACAGPAAGTGFTAREAPACGGHSIQPISEDRIQSAAGSIAATFTASSNNSHLTQAMAFAAAPAASAMDYIVGMPWVDYARNYVYVVSRSNGGTQPSLWVINSLSGALVTSFSLGDIEASPTLSVDGNTLYVATTSGNLYAVNMSTLNYKWASPYYAALGSAVQGFIWENGDLPGRLYFGTTNGYVWALQDPGAGAAPPNPASPVWKTAVAAPSTPLPLGNPLDKLYVGSSDGKVHQLNLTSGVDEKQFTVGGGAYQVGDVSSETGNEIFVPTTEGTLYKLPVPLP
jgi:hypothetical protein